MTAAVWVALAVAAASLAAWLWAARPKSPTQSSLGLPDGLTLHVSHHARDRMQQRQVDRDAVETVVRKPDRVEHDPRQNSYRFERDFEDRTVKVWVPDTPWPPVGTVTIKTTAASYRRDLSIPVKAVGRVKGPRGATIKRVETATNTKISVGQAGDVLIKADAKFQLDHALRMIREIAGIAEPPDAAA